MQKNTAKNTPTKPKDWHRADVIAALKKKGWSLRALSRAAGMAETTLYNALKYPYPRGERIIAQALGLEPDEIWPQRYAERNFKPVFSKAVNA